MNYKVYLEIFERALDELIDAFQWAKRNEKDGIEMLRTSWPVINRNVGMRGQELDRLSTYSVTFEDDPLATENIGTLYIPAYTGESKWQKNYNHAVAMEPFYEDQVDRIQKMGVKKWYRPNQEMGVLDADNEE